ncbi:uncharacterized protein LOC142533054 [Primulina tabacum]|uniref:uncharacterized protein LOC142533054 n=1 Tax=Primulina tabacum TaxID=48773 RepID=UPI003F59B64F
MTGNEVIPTVTQLLLHRFSCSRFDLTLNPRKNLFRRRISRSLSLVKRHSLALSVMIPPPLQMEEAAGMLKSRRRAELRWVKMGNGELYHDHHVFSTYLRILVLVSVYRCYMISLKAF